MEGVKLLITIVTCMALLIGLISLLAYYYTLNGIKSRTTGDGQHGTARWITKKTN